MTEYRCPACDTGDPNLYMRCYRPDCPGGRDRPYEGPPGDPVGPRGEQGPLEIRRPSTSFRVENNAPDDPKPWSATAVFLMVITFLAAVLIFVHFKSAYHCEKSWTFGGQYDARYTYSTGCLVAPKGTQWWVPERAIRKR